MPAQAGGAGVPLDGLVVDQYGLAYAPGSHLTGDPNGRPGHTKWPNARRQIRPCDRAITQS